MFSFVRLFVIPWTVAPHAPRSMDISRQEYWSGLPFPSAEDLPFSGIELGLPHRRQTLPSESLGKPPRIDNNKCLYCAVFKALCSKICSSLSSLPLHDNPIRRRLLLSFTSYRWENESMETLRSLQLTQIVDLEFESRQCN